MPVFLGFIAFSLVEIWLLIKIGGLIGGWTTIAWILATAIAGSLLLRQQGTQALTRIRTALENSPDGRPDGAALATELLDGLTVLLAGVFLILPGFLTDAIGLLLFIPALRHGIGRLLWSWLQGSERMRVYATRTSWSGPNADPGPRSGGTTVIEGEFREIDEQGAGPVRDRPQDPNHPRLR